VIQGAESLDLKINEILDRIRRLELTAETRKRAPPTPASRSNTNTATSAPMLDAPARVAVKDSIKVNTNVLSVEVDPALLNRPSPSVRDVAKHAAMLKSVLSRLGPIYDLIEREASRMTEASPFLEGKNQVRHTSVVRISGIEQL